MGLCEQGREGFLCATTKHNPAHERKETEGQLLLKAGLHVTDPVEEILVLSLELLSCTTWTLCICRIPVSVLPLLGAPAVEYVFVFKTKGKTIPTNQQNYI